MRMGEVTRKTFLTAEHVAFFRYMSLVFQSEWCCAGSFPLCEYMKRNCSLCAVEVPRPNDCDVFCVFPAVREWVDDLLDIFGRYSGVKVENVVFWNGFGKYVFSKPGIKGIVEFDLSPSSNQSDVNVKHRIQLILTSRTRWMRGIAPGISYSRFIVSSFDLDIVRVWLVPRQFARMGFDVECYDMQTQNSILNGTFTYIVQCGYIGSGAQVMRRIEKYMNRGFRLLKVEYVRDPVCYRGCEMTSLEGSSDESLCESTSSGGVESDGTDDEDGGKGDGENTSERRTRILKRRHLL